MGDVGREPRALRLTFSYEGDQIQLAGSREIEMTVPASGDLEWQQERSGSWIELRDSSGRPLYRRGLDRLLPTDVEIVPEGEGRPFTRAVLSERTGTFDVLLPVLEAADSVALLTGQPTRAAGAEQAANEPVPASEVAVLSVRDLLRQGEGE